MFLVLLNGFFVAAEFAMVKVRSSRLDTLVHEGNNRAKYAKHMTDNLDAYLSACQLGITLASLGLGWIGEPAIAKVIEPILVDFGFSTAMISTVSFAIAFSIITALHIILGELAPKSLAIQKADSVTMWTAVPLIAFHKLMFPIIWVLNGLANLILRSVGIEIAGEHEVAHTEDEIRILMEESHQQGFIDQTELTYVGNIFDFIDRHVNEVMIPRTDMFCLYEEDDFNTNLAKVLDEQLTRYPVCAPDKDHIIGFVHIKDFLTAVATDEKRPLRSMVREIIAIPETMPISKLLKLMQKNKAQIALVIDEYGGTAGLVTFEDILEEIVGEIQDEFDEERPPIEVMDTEVYSIDGKVVLDDVNSLLNIAIDTENFDTIGGWMATNVEELPQKGQQVIYDNWVFTIEAADNMRVTRVLVNRNKINEELATEI
ncbi:MAG TPA: HlyC/CorC family transporter [Candidatus Avacidaminococcus intestinavium]|uniref:HlyC/CorC family transporter n=1 Tax=Candidatus Avacidaminococcus intestinavium TaxID=2840684 RepID=A0A9D1MP48_9FIRM|nr:HlyC/CorC family transporter [Candidatus Avacidaminococcus intestinavium]